MKQVGQSGTGLGSGFGAARLVVALRRRGLARSRRPGGGLPRRRLAHRREVGGPQRRTSVAGQAGGLPVAVAAEPLVRRVVVGVRRAGAAGVLDGVGVSLAHAALHADAQRGEQRLTTGLALVGHASEDVADPLVHQLGGGDAAGLLHGGGQLLVRHQGAVAACGLQQHRPGRVGPGSSGGRRTDLRGITCFGGGIDSHGYMSTRPPPWRHGRSRSRRACASPQAKRRPGGEAFSGRPS